VDRSNEGVKDVSLPALRNKPRLIYFKNRDIAYSFKGNWNHLNASYWGIDNVRALPQSFLQDEKRRYLLDEGDVKALCELGEAGVLEAQIDLGRMYDPGVSGDETQKDYAEALKWYAMASEQGDLYSKIRLVQFYAFGLGTQKSLWKAFMYVGSYLWAL